MKKTTKSVLISLIVLTLVSSLLFVWPCSTYQQIAGYCEAKKGVMDLGGCAAYKNESVCTYDSMCLWHSRV